MSIELPFSNNTINTYAYEAFSYRIPNPSPGFYELSVRSTIGSNYFQFTYDSVVFETLSNGIPIGTQTFTVTATSGATTVGTSSNTVIIGPGRFLDATTGNSFVGSNYTFYAKTPITPITLSAPFLLSTPTSSPSLPPGLSFSEVDGTFVSIVGTPQTTVPQSNYLIIGKQIGSSRVVSSTISFVINGERVVSDVSPSDIISDMTVGTSITPTTITSAANGTVRYTWPSLPDGLYVEDTFGNVVTSGFVPSGDPSNSIIIRGAPTLAAANAFKSAGGAASITQSFLVQRISPLPLLSNAIPITFNFGETVLFGTPVIPNLYDGVSVIPGSGFFPAETYFETVAMSNIFSPDLRSDLSLAFNAALSRADLFGLPTSAGTDNYTIRAVNSNNVSRDLIVSITVSNDSVSFLPPTPASNAPYNFVISRPIDLPLTGYYPAPITFTAAAASQKTILWSAPGLAGTGLSLSATTGSTTTIVGTPTTLTPLQTLSVRADVSGSSATATRNIQVEIIDDIITITPPTSAQLSFIQNKTITPVQLTATSLSGRQVVSYSATGLPIGLSISSTGQISGAPLSGTSGVFTVTASTGFASQAVPFSYTITPDTILFFANSPVSYSPNASVFMPISGIAYSGITPSNYQFSNFTQSYGLSIDSITGNISGTLLNGATPPNSLPVLCNFFVRATTGVVDASLSATLSTVNTIALRSFLFNQTESNYDSPVYIDDTEFLTDWQNFNVNPDQPGVTLQWITDLAIKNQGISALNSNIFVMTLTGASSTGPAIIWSQDGRKFAPRAFQGNDHPYKVVYGSNTTWYIGGSTPMVGGSNTLTIYRSTDDALTWSAVNIFGASSRQSIDYSNYYTFRGVAFGYSGGIFMMGGGPPNTGETATLWRSDGTTRERVDSTFVEVGNLSMDGPVWVVTGSSLYSSGSSNTFTDPAKTLRWSDDQGLTWNDATGTTCDYIAYEVAYGSNRWLSTGMMRDGTATKISSKLLCSSDGKDWSNVSLPAAFTEFTTQHLPEVNSLWFDGTNWNVLVKYDSGGYDCTIFSHDAVSSLVSGWSIRVLNVTPFNGTTAVPQGFWQQYVRTGITGLEPTVSTFTFNTLPSGGPTVTSPTQRSFLFYQYVPITPITVSALGVGTVYYFAQADTLPDGITFDPLTGIISGTSVVLGARTFVIYVKDRNGVTAVTINTTTIIPRIIRQQDGAGAYTSLVRQYTEVNAAVTARDSKALPAMEYRLGEFTSPEPPSVITATSDKCNC
jgi:hypothetical protein